MASSAKNTLRFAVGTPELYHSAVWRVWVERDEVYASARFLAGLLKLSLHHSGIWRLAWTSESGLLAPGSSDRVEERWQRPGPFRPHWTQGPSIIIPNTGAARPLKRSSSEGVGDVRWLPLPPSGYSARFTLLFADPQATDENSHGVLGPADECIAILQLASDGQLVITKRLVPIGDDERNFVTRFTAETRIHSTEAIALAAPSILTAGTDNAGYPYLLEVSLSTENVAPAKPPV